MDEARIGAAVTALNAEILTLKAKGDYAKAKAWLDKMAVVRPDVKKVLWLQRFLRLLRFFEFRAIADRAVLRKGT